MSAQYQSYTHKHCIYYWLPTISEHGLREVINQPARLAGLDVTEITAAILADARDEIGALPLVENALWTLWANREGKGNRLSGKWYSDHGGITGILSTQADALLERIHQEVPNGKQAALELLMRLMRINEEGRHTRQRITREEAVFVAEDPGNTLRDLVNRLVFWAVRKKSIDAKGERVVQLLSGERQLDVPSGSHKGTIRLIATSTEKVQIY